MLTSFGRNYSLIQPFGKLVHVSSLENGHRVWFQKIERDGLLFIFSVSDHNDLIQFLRLFQGNDNNAVGCFLTILLPGLSVF